MKPYGLRKKNWNLSDSYLKHGVSSKCHRESQRMLHRAERRITKIELKILRKNVAVAQSGRA